jgi:methylmalonyl-CoA/ethylmalonyl-CoA epimerase
MSKKEPEMPLKRLDHITFRVTEVKPVVEFYTKTLGFHVVQNINLDFGETKAFSSVLSLVGTGFYIFVDQGMDSNNVVSKWVEKNGSGLHHMAYLVDNIDSAAGNLKEKGMIFTTDDVVDTGGGLKQLFSTPHPVTGVITEIIERYKEGVFFVMGNVLKLIKSTEKFNDNNLD